MTFAYRIIRSEHHEIGFVVRCLHNLSTALNQRSWQPDFDLLFLLLDYIESFPATFHHPKEEDYLFNAVRLRSPESAGLLDKLCADHADGLDLISDMRQSLEIYTDHPATRGWFCYAAQSFATHEQDHIQREERTILPLALQVLSTDDWSEIDAAFEQSDSPLLAAGRRRDFDRLFAQILQRMPPVATFDQPEARAV